MKTNEIKEITANTNLIAYCGLYCGACGSYLKGKCPGCEKNEKASWCKVRECCVENNFKSCADCEKTELISCRKYNNFMSKLIGVVLNSNRSACIARIKETGYEEFATEMSTARRQTIKRH